MAKIYSGTEAQEACKKILFANTDFSSGSVKYDNPVDGIKIFSAGYWEESGKWIAYDNRSLDCWMEEFDTETEAKAWIKGK